MNVTKIILDGQVADIPAGGSGGGTSLDIYSTDEQVIGRWINGKTLYRRVYQFTAPPINVERPITKFAEIDTMVHIEAAGDGRNAWTTLPSNLGYLYFNKSAKELGCCVNTSDLASRPIYAILEYTKTAD